MKAYSDNATLIIAMSGNTGYASCSNLLIEISGLGRLQLAHDEWDFKHLDVESIKSVELSIPSGLFELEVRSIAHITDCSQHCLRLTGYGQWEGKQGGLMGMSGYASFSLIDPLVRQGLFYHETPPATNPDCSLRDYNLVASRSRTLSAADPVWMKYADEAYFATTDPQPPEWAAWINYLLTPEAIALEEQIVAAAAERMQQRQAERIATRRSSVQETDDFEDFEDVED